MSYENIKLNNQNKYIDKIISTIDEINESKIDLQRKKEEINNKLFSICE
jgi:hypothetical protein